jgi:hypothetical protein
LPGLVGNVPVDTWPDADTWASWPPASDDPSPSTIITVGSLARSCRLVFADSAAPPDRITVRLDRS